MIQLGGQGFVVSLEFGHGGPLLSKAVLHVGPEFVNAFLLAFQRGPEEYAHHTSGYALLQPLDKLGREGRYGLAMAVKVFTQYSLV